MDRKRKWECSPHGYSFYDKTRFELMEIFRRRDLLKTWVKSCLQLQGIKRCPSVFVLISVYFSWGCRLIPLWHSQRSDGGCREGRREEALLRTVTSLAWKCIFLSLSSLCPPTEIFVAKSLYFGSCKNLCLSINWWMDRQTEEAHEQVLNGWGPQEAQNMQENGRNQVARKNGTQ